MMSLTWLNTILVRAGCLALGYYIGKCHPSCLFVSGQTAKGTPVVVDEKKNKPKEPIENLDDILEDFKMVLVVRNDLKMSKGKIASQCSHATSRLYKIILYQAPKALHWWEMGGQVKVVVKIDSEEELLILREKAESLQLPTHVTNDAERALIAPDSSTVMAIFGPAKIVDDITRMLKLL